MNDVGTQAVSSRVADDLPGVREMFADLAASPPVVRPSAYWDHINECNLAQLERDGFERFKRSINQNYFAFVPCGPGDDQYDAVRKALPARAWPLVNIPRTIDVAGVTTMFDESNPLGDRRRQRGHARYLAMLWESVRRRDRLGLLEHLEEPSLGTPISIRYRRRRVSQDLCNSVHEFYSATEHSDVPSVGAVLELGGGYGRLAWVFLRRLPNVRYLVCDIPPALSVAQRYLTTLFPDRTAFTFRRFDRYEDVADEFGAAHLRFITPGQLSLIPPQHADLFINVSSLHEMRRDQIAYFLAMVDRHCAGCFYSKQWLRSVNDRDGLELGPADYPIPSHWTELYMRDHDVQTLFFEALYRVR